MAKARRLTRKKREAPSTLSMRLYAPGMSILHRAGLGGLACTLRYIERAYRTGMLQDDDVPGGPWCDGTPPWHVEPLEVLLDFGQPDRAAEFLRRLFRIGFDVRDGLVHLPGHYAQEPSLAVRAELQAGLTLSFLQHGRVRKLAADSTVCQHDIDGTGQKLITVEYRQCMWYKHQDGWKDLCDKKGCLRLQAIEVIGPISPGAVVRHVQFSAQTKIEEDVEHIVPLYFALVGCLALSINRGSGVLVVPDVQDLCQFCTLRPWMTPSSSQDCRVTSAADAALQAQVRLKVKRLTDSAGVPASQAITFRPTQWSTQQKSRVDCMHIPAGEESRLEQFEVALAELPPRVASRTTVETGGRGERHEKRKKTEWFWVDSIVRSLVAKNLACGEPWYCGFVDLMVKMDPSGRKPLRDRLSFEKKGLHAMIEKIPWKERGEGTIVKAMHEAIRRRYGQIADENKSNPVARKKRWKSEYDRWRLAFAGAKTPEQFRYSLCDLFSRAGINSVLQADWQAVLPMLDPGRWQLARDLALLGLASYTGTGAKEVEEIAFETENE